MFRINPQFDDNLLPKRFCLLEGGPSQPDTQPAEPEKTEAVVAQPEVTETPEQVEAREAAETETVAAESAAKAAKLTEESDADMNDSASQETGENLAAAEEVRQLRIEKGGAMENFPPAQEAVAAYSAELGARLDKITATAEA